MSFYVKPLPATDFRHLYGKSDAELTHLGMVAMIADEMPGFPCRVSLRDIEPGGRLILLNYEHQSAPTPYRSSHAIFVSDGAEMARLAPDHLPDMLTCRQISVRAFDAAGIMRDALVIPGDQAAQTFDAMLDKAEVDYLHVHTAARGCYLARIARLD